MLIIKEHLAAEFGWATALALKLDISNKFLTCKLPNTYRYSVRIGVQGRVFSFLSLPFENTFLAVPVARTLGDLIVEYCGFCIIDLKTAAHVFCIEVVVACFPSFFPLFTKCSIANTVPKPKPACAQS